MSDLESDDESDSAAAPFSWRPPLDITPFSLFLSQRKKLTFLVLGDHISKSRIERLLRDFGGDTCRNVIEPSTVVLVAEHAKAKAHWGPVFSRRWVRDSIQSFSLKELSDYLIEGCQRLNLPNYANSLTTALFYEKLKFRQSLLNVAFFSNNLVVLDKNICSKNIKILCNKCKNACYLNSLSGQDVTDDNIKINDEKQPTREEDEQPGGSSQPNTCLSFISSSCDSVPQNEQVASAGGSVSNSNLLPSIHRKKIGKRCLPIQKDLRNMSECSVILDRPLTKDDCAQSDEDPSGQDSNDTAEGDEEHTDQPVVSAIFQQSKKAKLSEHPDETGNCLSPKSGSNKSCTSLRNKLGTDQHNKPGTSRHKSKQTVPHQTVSSSSHSNGPGTATRHQSDSDDSLPDLKNWGKLKKYAIENKHTKSKFSREEKTAILRFIVSKRAYYRLKSDALYREMEERNVCPKRTYQSMKNHFLKTLLNELDTFDFLTDDVKRLLRGQVPY